jgi:hypothetical protein
MGRKRRRRRSHSLQGLLRVGPKPSVAGCHTFCLHHAFDTTSAEERAQARGYPK